MSHTGNCFSPSRKPVDGDSKTMAHVFKRSSEVGNVPFAAIHRMPHDDTKDRTSNFSKAQFTWKSPTMMKM